jgi:hypothetical protein
MGAFCAVTSFFNPLNYRSRREHYDTFRAELERNGVTLYTIEGYFPGSAPTLTSYDRVTGVELSSVLWHKERLLNLLIAALPERYTKVAWLDCDLIFADPAWHERTADSLDSYGMVQCFGDVLQLRPGAKNPYPGDSLGPGFAKALADSAGFGYSGIRVHGRTGFAWAARRDFLQDVGLYDTHILGGSDHLMSHAFTGAEWDHPCVIRESAVFTVRGFSALV